MSHTRNETSAVPLRMGLALGGGGAVGLAHIPVLEVLDEFNLRPHAIAGASIGAIIGALYASGKSAAEIKRIVRDVVSRDKTSSWKGRFFDRRLLKWVRFIDPELGEGGLVGGDAFIAFLRDTLHVDTFEALPIPLRVVTTDYWDKTSRVFDAGDLMKPIQASMAIPGLFSPVRIGGRTFVDGALTNPVPYDEVPATCDFVVAVDVIGDASPRDDVSFMDAIHMAGRILLRRQMELKLDRARPDIYIDTHIHDVNVLDFFKFEAIYEQGLVAADSLRSALARRLQ